MRPAEAWFWGAHSGGGLDLLIVERGRRIGFEVKFSEAPSVTKSTRNVTHALGPRPSVHRLPSPGRLPGRRPHHRTADPGDDGPAGANRRAHMFRDRVLVNVRSNVCAAFVHDLPEVRDDPVPRLRHRVYVDAGVHPEVVQRLADRKGSMRTAEIEPASA